MEQFEDFLEWAEECIATGKLFSSPPSLWLLWAGVPCCVPSHTSPQSPRDIILVATG